MIKIAIVDDIKQDAERLYACCTAWAARQHMELSVRYFSSGDELLSGEEAGLYELIFLDIYMTGKNGIETAKLLRQKNLSCMIVFLTSSQEHAWESFPLHPFDYIVKPYGRERIFAVLSDAAKVLSDTPTYLEITLNRQKIRLHASDICYAEAANHHVHITLTDGRTLKSYMRFLELQEALDTDARFLLCNRGVIINMDCIDKSDENFFYLNNGSRIPLRIRDSQSLRNTFAAYQFERAKKWKEEKNFES